MRFDLFLKRFFIKMSIESSKNYLKILTDIVQNYLEKTPRNRLLGKAALLLFISYK